MPQGPRQEEKKALEGEGKAGYFRNLRGSWSGPFGSQGCEASVRRPRVGAGASRKPGWGRDWDEDAAAGADAEAAAQNDSRSPDPAPGGVERPAPRSRGRSARPVPPAHSGPGQGLRAAMGPAATTHPEG